MRPYLITTKLMRPSNMKRFPTPGLEPSPPTKGMSLVQSNLTLTDSNKIKEIQQDLEIVLLSFFSLILHVG
jgi:hypothetical protein